MGKTIEDVFLEVMKNRTNGLAVLEVPTGRGKTHSAISAIRKILQDENGTKRRVYFVSPQLKNLPKGDQLRKVFAGDEYAWLRLERNSKSVEENLPSLFPFLPECVKKIPACQDLLCLIRQYREARKHAGSGNIGESGNNFVEAIGDSIREKEQSFRKELKRVIKTSPVFRQLRESSKAKGPLFYKTLEFKFPWLLKLYPSIAIDRSSVIFLSAKKFQYPVDPIAGKPSFLTSAGRLGGNILFLDEFDSVFREFDDVMLEDAVKTQKNALSVFCLIRNALDAAKLPKNVILADSMMKGTLTFSSLKGRADEIYSKYHLGMSYRTSEDEQEDDRCFIFQDLTTSTIFMKDGHTHLLARLDDEKHRVTVRQVDNPTYAAEKDDSIQIHSLLSDISRFFMRFCSWVNSLSEHYVAVCNQGKDEFQKKCSDAMTMESARSSILDALKLDEALGDDFFRNNLCYFRKKQKIPPVFRNLSYYQLGFDIFEIENSENHQENTKFLSVARRMTPEQLLCYLAKHCLVIALSATAKWDTGNNFDLGYCQEILGDDYIDLNKLLGEEPPDDSYEKAGVRVLAHKIDGKNAFDKSRRNMESFLCKMFPGSEGASRRLAKKILADVDAVHPEEKSDKDYLLIRYIELFLPISDFVCSSSARAWIFLNTRKLGCKEGFQKNIVEEYVNLCRKNLQKDEKEVVPFFLTSSSKYDEQIKAVFDALADGKRVMVFASYNSIMTGQNLQYPVSGMELASSRCIRPDADPSDSRLFLRDFDGIVLGGMSHVMWMPDADSKNPEKDILAGITEYEIMMERGIISRNEGRRYIRDILKRSMKRERKKSNIFFRRRVMRQLIQATGRLSRSFLKCPEIHIFVSSSVLSSIDPKEMREHPLTTEQLAVARLAGKYYTVDKDEAFCKLLNDAENINAKAMTQILRLLNEGWKNGWTSEMIKIWAKMRELALRFPTFEEIPDEFKDFASLFYFQRPEDHSLQYFFASRNDYGRGTVISFNREIEDFLHFLEKDGDDSLIPQKMDEAGSRLDVMLKVPGFREYMESHGYRTEFGNGRYVMTPAFYNNVYKGALGEIFCEFFFEKLGYPLHGIKDASIFELFDFVFHDGLFVDAKNWSENFEVRNSEEQKKIHAKLQETGGCTMIVNIVDNGKHCASLSSDKKVLTIPGLIRPDGRFLEGNIRKILQFAGKKEADICGHPDQQA